MPQSSSAQTTPPPHLVYLLCFSLPGSIPLICVQVGLSCSSCSSNDRTCSGTSSWTAEGRLGSGSRTPSQLSQWPRAKIQVSVHWATEEGWTHLFLCSSQYHSCVLNYQLISWVQSKHFCQRIKQHQDLTLTLALKSTKRIPFSLHTNQSGE